MQNASFCQNNPMFSIISFMLMRLQFWNFMNKMICKSGVENFHVAEFSKYESIGKEHW